jgi:hypothetical protein
VEGQCQQQDQGGGERHPPKGEVKFASPRDRRPANLGSCSAATVADATSNEATTASRRPSIQASKAMARLPASTPRNRMVSSRRLANRYGKLPGAIVKAEPPRHPRQRADDHGDDDGHDRRPRRGKATRSVHRAAR